MLGAFLESPELEEFIDNKRKREGSSSQSGSWSSLKRSRRAFDLTSLEEEVGRNYSSSFSSDDSDSSSCPYRFRGDSCGSSSIAIDCKDEAGQSEDVDSHVALSLGSMCFELNMKSQRRSKSNDLNAFDCFRSENGPSNLSTLTK